MLSDNIITMPYPSAHPIDLRYDLSGSVLVGSSTSFFDPRRTIDGDIRYRERQGFFSDDSDE